MTSATGGPDPEGSATEDPTTQARHVVRKLAFCWGLPAAEIAHVLAHHRDPEQARNLLWTAR